MSLRSAAGAARRGLLRSLHRRMVPLGDGGPFVSFAFDDFPRTAYTAGGSILKSLGFRGTYYVAMGLMGTSNELGEQFRMEDLRSLAAEGHEVGSHTFSHGSSRAASAAAFLEDVKKGDGAIHEMAKLTPSGNFAYPYGEVALAAKRAVGGAMTSCRSIYGGVNGPFADLNLLSANSLYGGVDRLPAVRELVLENERRKGWLIFYTHDVRFNPSRYGCTPELLQAAALVAGERGARVLPVAGVLGSLPGAPERRRESANREVNA